MRPQVVQRFLQEARSAAKIVHPGIVTVYECGHVDDTRTAADGTVYIAMELLQGEDLTDLLERGPLDISIAVGFGMQLAAGLEAAHKNGVVHRDLKPDNIFLVPDASVEGGQRLKILDFGIAKLADADAGRQLTQNDTGATGVHTHSMMMLGTPRYMSPEQCKSSARVDHRSDIYALGCILFEMVAGHSPFDGDAGELIAKHQLASIPRLRTHRPETPAYLDVLVSTMLAKDPGDRPQTMEKVREALATATSPFKGNTQPVDTTLGAATGEPEPMTVIEQPPLKTVPRWWFVAGAAALSAAIVLGMGLSSRSDKPVAKPTVAPTPPPTQPTPTPAEPPGPDRAAKEIECRAIAAERKWDDLLVCTDALARLAPGDPVVRELTTMSVIEARNATVFGKFQEAVGRSDMAEAYRLLDRIDDESVYKEAANEEVDRLAATMPTSKDPRAAGCNADKLSQRAQSSITQGQYTQALALIEASMRCKPDQSLNRLALLAACNAGNPAKAKRYFGKIPASQQTPMARLCLRNKITLP
jgi:serine/threonine protein kinase